MIKTLLLTLAFTQPVADGSTASAAHFDIKGVTLGMSSEEAKAAVPDLECHDSPGDPLGDATCRFTQSWGSSVLGDSRRWGTTYAEVPVQIVLRFYSGKLASIRVSEAHAAHFDKLRMALQTKFGEPTTARTEEVKNRAGTAFENRILEWTRGDETLELEEMAGKIDTSAIVVNTPASTAEFERRFAARAKQATSDM